MARRVKRSSMRKRRSMRGGWQKLSPAPVEDASMAGPTQMSNAQGQEYDALHQGQHGGGSLADPAPMSAGDQGLLPADLRSFARVTPQDNSMAEIQGMKDQGGGGKRRRSTKKSMYGGKRRRSTKKNMYGGKRRRSTKKNMYGGQQKMGMYGGKRSRKSRRKTMYGGQPQMLNPDSASLDSKSAMILPSSATEQGMNPEWKLAHNPTSFVPDSVKATTGAM